MSEMERASVGGVELEYKLEGSGEPVVLIHWGIGARWAEPLEREPALAGRHQLLTYHRAGFAGSDRVEGAITMADHAEQCRLLMSELGVGRAHIVGHSSSALVALQVALDFPDAVQSLTLMEPAGPIPETDAQAEFAREFIGPAVELYRAGDREAALERFATGVFGRGYREPLERGLPGAFEQALADVDTFFGQELPATRLWDLTADDASRITQPVLAVLGERTARTFPERLELLASWLPRVELFQLSGATHLLHVEEPRSTAEALAEFFARHPTASSKTSAGHPPVREVKR